MKNTGDIVSWRPFRAEYINYDDRRVVITFRCPKCGNDGLTRPNGRTDDRWFTQGHFVCSKCGLTHFGLDEEERPLPLCYYNEAFTTQKVEQLQLF